MPNKNPPAIKDALVQASNDNKKPRPIDDPMDILVSIFHLEKVFKVDRDLIVEALDYNVVPIYTYFPSDNTIECFADSLEACADVPPPTKGDAQ